MHAGKCLGRRGGCAASDHGSGVLLPSMDPSPCLTGSGVLLLAGVLLPSMDPSPCRAAVYTDALDGSPCRHKLDLLSSFY